MKPRIIEYADMDKTKWDEFVFSNRGGGMHIIYMM